MKILADKNLPLTLSRLGLVKLNDPGSIVKVYELFKDLSLNSCLLNVKPYTVIARSLPHLALLIESDDDYLFGFSATHSGSISGIESISFDMVQRALQHDLILENKGPLVLPDRSYLASSIFHKKVIRPFKSLKISESMGLDNEFEYKKIFNLSLNHLRFSVLDNIVNDRLNHILLNPNTRKTQNIILDYKAKDYIGEKVFNDIFPEIFNDNIVYEDSQIKEGLVLYQKIINTDYLWNLGIQGNKGLISYDEYFNVLTDIIGGGF
jgi:hypothetical protein